MLALKILQPFINRDDVLITALSPAELTVAVLQRLGFKLLDEEQYAVPVLPGILPLFPKSKRPLILFDDPTIENYVDQSDLKIFKDHAALACRHFLIRENDTNRYCYGIATTSRVRKLAAFERHWLNLCYLSNSEVFTRNFRSFGAQLWKRGFLAVCYDSRLLPGKLSRICVKKKKKRQYRCKDGDLRGVDNLYSELVTFNKY